MPSKAPVQLSWTTGHSGLRNERDQPLCPARFPEDQAWRLCCHAPPLAPNAMAGQVLDDDEGVRTAAPNVAQVIREDDLAVISICTSWILDRLPGTGMRVRARSPKEKPR